LTGTATARPDPPAGDPVAKNHAAVRRLHDLQLEADFSVEPEPELMTGSNPLRAGSSRIRYWLSPTTERFEETQGGVTTTGVKVGGETRMVSCNPGRNKDGTDHYACALGPTLTACGATPLFHKLLLYHGREEGTLQELKARGVTVTVEPDTGQEVWVRFEESQPEIRVRARLVAERNSLIDRLEYSRTFANGKVTGHISEVRRFLELEPGVFLPAEVVSDVVSNGKKQATNRFVVRSARSGADVPDAGRPLPFPPNTWVRNLLRNTVVMTDAAGNLTGQEVADQPPETTIIGQTEPALPTAAGGSTLPPWMWWAIAAALVVVSGILLVMLTRRKGVAT
jgi:hypothetical protein